MKKLKKILSCSIMIMVVILFSSVKYEKVLASEDFETSNVYLQYSTENNEIDEVPIIKFSTDKPSPQYSGSTIQMTAEVKGSGEFKYKFLIRNDKGNWYLLRDYDTSNSYKWQTGAAGDKILYVDVKDNNGKVTRKSMNYTVKVNAPVISSFTADKASPQQSRTQITLMASASGKGTLYYKFLVNDNNGNWFKIRDYSKSNICEWNPSSVGSKTLYVDVKDEDGKVTRKAMGYVIKEAPAPTINSFSTDKTSPQNVGEVINFKVEASGAGKLQYKFSIEDESGKCALLRDYNYLNTYEWKTSVYGNKTIYVDVKDENGKVTRSEIKYVLNKIYKINSVDFNKAISDEMYRLVNEHRNNNGLVSYKIDSVMEECAYGKSKHMSDNNYFSHDYNGEYWWNMYPEKYSDACALGENIIRSYINPNKIYTEEECNQIAKNLFEGWKNSSGHNANMLSQNFEAIGFGIYVNTSGYIYGTQEFIKRW